MDIPLEALYPGLNKDVNNKTSGPEAVSGDPELQTKSISADPL